MDARNLGYVGVFIAFFVVSVAGNRRILDKAWYANGVRWRTRDIDENSAEDLVSMFCRKQLKQITEANIPDLTNHNMNTDASSIRKMLVRKVIMGRPPKLEQSLLPCLQSKRLLSDNPNKENLQEFLRRLDGHNGRILKPRFRRRRRRRRRRRWRRPRDPPWAEVPSPSQAYGSAPTPILAPYMGPSPMTPDMAPSSTWSPDVAPSPTSTLDEAPSPTPTRNPILKPKPKPKSSPKPVHNADSSQEENTEKPSDLPPESNSKERKLLIIAVVSTIVASLAILSLCLVCFLRLKKQRRENNNAHVEGQPLATGSSLQKSKKVGNTQDIIHNLSTKGASMPEDQGAGGEFLPLPPGRFAPSSSSSSSLSPPPEPPSPPPPPPPPPPLLATPAPQAPPPPPPKAANVPNPPVKKPPPPAVPRRRGRSGDESNQTGDPDSNKTKLKPFFWDKVNASPDRSMVWHDIRAGSFQFNEEMMEDLFGYSSTAQNKNENGKNPTNLQTQPKLIQIIEPKKAQNLAILLKALNVTIEEVSDAIMEGNELPVEFISTLLKMAPTQDEELKLRTYTGDLALLGPSERFLKVMVDIPFAFKRLEALLFMSTLQEESSSVKESFSTLEVACTTLRNSRLFLKLLEAVLKTGNRMNVGTYRGGAQAFKLDTLLKLSDVKGTDGKTTLLSFVVQEMIRSEGNKAARASQSSSEDMLQQPSKEAPENYRRVGLDVVSKLSEELEDVKRAALVDGDILTSTVVKLGHMLQKNQDFLNNEMKTVDEDAQFRSFLMEFIERAEAEIGWLLEEEKRIMSVVKSTGDYFHGTSRKDEGLRLFVIVRDFLVLLDSVCNDLRKTTAMKAKNNRSNSNTPTEASFGRSDQRDNLFLFNKDGQSNYSGSDDESDSF